MDEIKQILDYFDSGEKWKAYINLSNKRDALVSELYSRFLNELKGITSDYSEYLADSGWEFQYSNNDFIAIKPTGTDLIGVIVEWQWWVYPWGKRGAFIWVDSKRTDSLRVFEKLKSIKGQLPLNDYLENYHNHQWLPFVKQIPSTIFTINGLVDDQLASFEECFYLAKDNAYLLATNLWNDVFSPFISKEIATKMVKLTQ